MIDNAKRIVYHVSMRKQLYSTLTERGQTSVPADIRYLLNLKPGQKLLWSKINDHEVRVTAEHLSTCVGPIATLGFARKFNPGDYRGSDEILRELRGGEE